MRTSTRQPRLITVALTAMWLAVAFHGAHALLGFGGARLTSFCNTWVYTVPEVMAVAICAARVWARREDRLAWALIAFGLLTWTAGDLVWTLWLDNVANPPYPSIADPLYLAMYPAMYASLMLLLRSRRGRVTAEQWLDGGMVALALAAVGAGLILPTVLQIDDGRLVEDMVNLAYPLGDLTLLVFVVLAFALYSWRPDRVWLYLGAAMVLDGVADLIFTYVEAKGTYVAGSIMDTMWPAAMAMFAVAAWQPSGRRAARSAASFQIIVLPLIFVAVALAVLVVAAFTDITPTAVALAAGALVIGMVRAVLTFMENIRMLRRSAHDAMTDGLSDLGNRRKLLRDLDIAIAETDPDHPHTVVFFDLNGFKRYNDTFGHAAGDALLARLGAALRAAIEGHGRAYRAGGDEFCLLLTGRFASDDPLIAAASAALTEQGAMFSVSAAHGLATMPDEATTTTAVLQLADQRMYAAKARASRGTPSRTHDVLLQVLSERTPDLHNHVNGVGRLVRDVGRELGLDADQLEEVLRAAELHRASHERWDGQGYPDGLAGTAIPVGARIIAACDALDAMTSDRCDQGARSLPEAVAELRRCSGTQFDPEVVDALCAQLGAAPATATAAPAERSAEGAHDAAVLAHGLQPILAGLAAEPAVHGDAEV